MEVADVDDYSPFRGGGYRVERRAQDGGRSGIHDQQWAIQPLGRIGDRLETGHNGWNF